MRHFTFLSLQHGQFTTSGCEAPYNSKSARQRLFLQYERMFSFVRSSGARLICRSTDKETCMAWTTSARGQTSPKLTLCR